MKLIDLEPELLRASVDGKLWHEVQAVDDAQGISFYCPRCQDTRVVGWCGTDGEIVTC